MPKGRRFPLEVMLRAMREVDNGGPVGVVCRKVGMAEKTFYRYREKYAGMEPTEARRLRELEEENAGSRSSSPSRCCTRRPCGTCSQKIGEARDAAAVGSLRAIDVRVERARVLSRLGHVAGYATLRLLPRSGR